MLITKPFAPFLARKRRDYGDDDDDFEMEPGNLRFVQSGPMMFGTDVIESEPKEKEFTGLLTAKGVPILRAFVPKPPIGFQSSKEPDQRYDCDPDEDYTLVTALGDDLYEDIDDGTSGA